MVPRIVGVMTSDVVLRAPCILRRWGITGCAIGREDVIQGYTPLFMGENHYSNFKQCHRIYTSHNYVKELFIPLAKQHFLAELLGK